ncbi:MAG: class II fructose-bisphosphate aldolase [Actinobacteria bacterium]|nr:class II fructose-bisphosphate aldolase [Actinomycetota bacterium]
MPPVNLKTLIEDAEAKGYAPGGFIVLGLEMIEGAVEAGQTSGVPLILNVHPS